MSRKNSATTKAAQQSGGGSQAAADPQAGLAPANLYRQIIQDVIKNLRSEFSYASVDEDVLVKLQQLWEQKLREEGTAPGFVGTLPAVPRATAAPAAPPPPPAANAALLNLSGSFDFSFAEPAAAAGDPLQSIFGGTSLGQSSTSWLNGFADSGSAPLASPAPSVLAAGAALIAPRVGGFKHEADSSSSLQPPSKRQVSSSKLPVAVPAGSQLDGAADGETGGASSRIASADSESATPAQPTRQQLDAELLRRLATSQAFRSTSQLDGFDDDDDDDEEKDGAGGKEGDAAASASVLADDLEKDPDDINDPDLDDESDPEAEETRNLVLCQFEKVTVKGKRKHGCSLKDGVMQLNGIDLLFSKCTGEFSFHKAPGK